ncbi:hypothetical protein [Agrobacterium sp. CNPSo 2736]|uniref:hypothetical protein n=1 Tax=Agrobacterium sp. CNPSo 2736 TaxID=2499627 RepID=UPI001FDF96F7|nr:hypothetical protein [Agrobacterium sp. CNPSo 2736]
MECFDLFMIDFGHVWMQKGRRLFRCLQGCHDSFLALFQRHHLRVDTLRCSALKDQIEKRVEFAVDLLYLGLSRLD